MQLEIGDIREGKVTGITKFGIFVELEKGITGLVHISEISKSFVVVKTNVGFLVWFKIFPLSIPNKPSFMFSNKHT